MRTRKNINTLRRKIFPSQKIAMLHVGRCGSTVVARMLNAHRKINHKGELFQKYANDEKIRDPEISNHQFAEDVINGSWLYYASKPYFMFATKILSHQHLQPKIVNMDLAEYIEYLTKLECSKFIVIWRENYLRYAVSVAVGKQNQYWHTRRKIDRPTKITLNLQSFKTGGIHMPLLELFALLDETYARLQKILKDKDTLYLSYEKDIENDPRIAYQKACAFLNLKPQKNITPPFHKTNPFTYPEMIENWDEVRLALEKTKYRWMLEN